MVVHLTEYFLTYSYFWVTGTYSVIYALTGRSPLRKFPRFLQLLHSLFYSTVTTYPFIVTTVFWSLISTPPHKKAFSTLLLQWTNISFHCLNSGFALFEVIFSAVSVQRWTHSLVVLGVMILYIAMAYIIRATAGFYVYEFMDTNLMGALTAAYIFGIGGMGTVAFFTVQGLVWIKGALGGNRIWKSKYDLPRWGFDQRMSQSSLGTVVEKRFGTVDQTRRW